MPRTSPPIRRATAIYVARENILQIVEATLSPLTTVLTLWGIAFYFEGGLHPSYLILSVILFSLSFPGQSRVTHPAWKTIRNILMEWFFSAGLIVSFGIVSGYEKVYPSEAILAWVVLTPTLQIATNLILKAMAPLIIRAQGPKKRVVIAGMNEQGIELSKRLLASEYSDSEFIGFFEDRGRERTPNGPHDQILGKLSSIANYVKDHDIHVIYLSLPMASHPRVLQILDDLKDTTASIYFVPDIFLTDLIQGRIDQVDGIPVVAVCESPFTGTTGIVKRLSDILFSMIILVLISPVLLAVSIGVKMSSPGPIIFKQRRYGLDGKEILVYKFRSMTVCEDGNQITQAQKQDSRITPFGAFIRKTSLDELPQFINVLQGRMSVVGPRPHAVAHNEQYRKIIKGYMIRHKVKPGITGWAQVNGLRGETDTLDKMSARVDYDIEYLRNWSLKLDFYIVMKTVWEVFLKGQKSAY